MMNPLLKIKLLLKYSRKEGQNVAAGNRRVSYLFKRVFQIEIQQVNKIKFLNFHCKQQQQHRRIRNLACEKSDLGRTAEFEKLCVKKVFWRTTKNFQSKQAFWQLFIWFWDTVDSDILNYFDKTVNWLISQILKSCQNACLLWKFFVVRQKTFLTHNFSNSTVRPYQNNSKCRN